jgi:ferritin
MIKDSVLRALNDQIHMELDSAYLYLAMSAHFEEAALSGMATWMRKQSQEEWDHAMRLYHHVVERGGRVVLEGIDQPPSDFGKPADAFQRALEHEREVTTSIHRLYELAHKESDLPAQIMLHWFITEQVEEERQAGDIVEQLRRAGDSGASLLLMDRALGARGQG